MDQFFKTKLCPWYTSQGTCLKGFYCTYAHSPEELRPAKNLTKTKLCQLWRKGACTQGALCNYAHGRNELRCTDDYYKTRLCRFWQRGECLAGQQCRHAHGLEELQPRKYRLTEREKTKAKARKHARFLETSGPQQVIYLPSDHTPDLSTPSPSPPPYDFHAPTVLKLPAMVLPMRGNGHSQSNAMMGVQPDTPLPMSFHEWGQSTASADEGKTHSTPSLSSMPSPFSSPLGPSAAAAAESAAGAVGGHVGVRAAVDESLCVRDKSHHVRKTTVDFESDLAFIAKSTAALLNLDDHL
mmetsp:Transcript_22916/g.56605  ORF Transcript_22916/g.56605 Transcript_22916/m.56605 type:complete len:297 (-) Transcript_22916:689-1579(-)